jgi:hypothetical protein
MFDWKHKALLLLLVAGIVAGFLGFRTWLSEHDLRLHAEEQSKAQQAVQAEVKSQMAELAKQMADRDAAYQTQLKSLGTKFQQAGTPDQLALIVSQLMGLKQPIQVVTPPANGGTTPQTPVAQIPVTDAPQVKAYFQECEQCKLDRAKLTADAADRAAQAALTQKQIDSLNKDVQIWKTTANGGTKWQRFKRASKWLAIGAGAGAVALCGTGHCKL